MATDIQNIPLAPPPTVTKTSSVTGTYTATSDDSYMQADATLGSFVLTMPTAATVKNRIFIIKKVDATANTVTVTYTSIDGAGTAVLGTQYDALTLISDGTNYGTPS